MIENRDERKNEQWVDDLHLVRLDQIAAEHAVCSLSLKCPSGSLESRYEKYSKYKIIEINTVRGKTPFRIRKI